MLQAKSSLSRLVEAIEQGRERQIVIACNGSPAAYFMELLTRCFWQAVCASGARLLILLVYAMVLPGIARRVACKMLD